MEQLNALEKLKTLVPEGYEPKDYISLISKQLMGVDKQGNSRSMLDMQYFLSVSKQLKLDPLARQIYPVFRFDSRQGKEVMAIQTSIDGFRLIAQRSGKYAGQDDAVFEEQDGHPVKATITVYLFSNNQKVSVTASARFSEYAQMASPMWSKMPFTMLGKCAESLALRKAFPAELSGLYTSEEMNQPREEGELIPQVSDKQGIRVGELDDIQEDTITLEEKIVAIDELDKPKGELEGIDLEDILNTDEVKIDEPKKTKKDKLIDELIDLFTEMGKSSDEMVEYVQKKFSVDSPSDLSEVKLDTIIKAIRMKLKASKEPKVKEEVPVKTLAQALDEQDLGAGTPTFDKGKK